MTTRVIGIDPGPVPGIVVLDVWETGAIGRVEALQSTHGLTSLLVEALLGEHNDPAYVAVERFVSRGRVNKAQQLTRDLVGQVQQVVRFNNSTMSGSPTRLVERPAVQVKAWATDERLEAAGLLEACKGMRHARDAARHALYSAVRDAGLPDPLSKDWSAR